MSDITHDDLISAGIPIGEHSSALIEKDNTLLTQKERDHVIKHLKTLYDAEYKPHYIPLLENPPELKINIEACNDLEQDNINHCVASMEEAAKTPTVRALSIMPDACPAGPLGTITVGGVIATENAIHPGMHSADVCCSMMATNLGKIDPSKRDGTCICQCSFWSSCKK